MTTRPIANNVIWYHATVTRRHRERQNGHCGAILWFTGLSGAGKPTLAHAVEEALHQRGCRPSPFKWSAKWCGMALLQLDSAHDCA